MHSARRGAVCGEGVCEELGISCKWGRAILVALSRPQPDPDSVLPVFVAHVPLLESAGSDMHFQMRSCFRRRRRKLLACPAQLEAAGQDAAGKLFDLVTPEAVNVITKITLKSSGLFRCAPTASDLPACIQLPTSSCLHPAACIQRLCELSPAVHHIAARETPRSSVAAQAARG